MAPEQSSSAVAQAVQDVSEKAQLLIREEIALAKAELTEKITKLIKGAVVGIAAGIFAVLGLIYLLHAASWGIWKLLTSDGSDNFWIGFLIVALILFVLGAVAGFLAAKFLKGGSPPTPQMAIEEAQLIRQTISSSGQGHGTSPVAATARASQSTAGAPDAPVSVSEARR